MNWIAEQEIVIWRSEEDQQRVTIRVGEPRLEKDRDGYDHWACQLQLDGLMEIDNPATGMSSFQAVALALAGARVLIRDETKGAKIYLVDNLRIKGELYPEGGVSVKELFEI